MLDKLKDLWSRWKVQVSVVGGVLVVATAYGTCSYDPPALEDATEEAPEAATEEAPEEVEVEAAEVTE